MARPSSLMKSKRGRPSISSGVHPSISPMRGLVKVVRPSASITQMPSAAASTNCRYRYSLARSAASVCLLSDTSMSTPR